MPESTPFMPAERGPRPTSLPKIAYVTLWFPLSSETFIFREISDLEALGLDISVYTLYGKKLKGCSRAMLEYEGSVSRMGIRSFFGMWASFFRVLKKKPALVWNLSRQLFFRKMRNMESLGENLWGFFAGFRLSEQCLRDNVSLIHSPWANGSATAAMVASHVSGIPFAFTGRAGDIYPQDGLLAEKAAYARFVRVNNAASLGWVSSFCPPEDAAKVKLVYNGLTFKDGMLRQNLLPEKPYHILAVGRFARTKGFPYLLTAMARLRREGFPIRLTLVGDGGWRGKLLRMRARLGLEDCVDMPGFVPNDKLMAFMKTHDLMVVPSVVHDNGDRDGIPNVIMEACSVGLPVVATDVSGISEVIRPGLSGRLLPQKDSGALALVIREALENWRETAAMAQNARELVLEMFDSGKNSMALRNIYINAAMSRKDE